MSSLADQLQEILEVRGEVRVGVGSELELARIGGEDVSGSKTVKTSGGDVELDLLRPSATTVALAVGTISKRMGVKLATHTRETEDGQKYVLIHTKESQEAYAPCMCERP